MLCSWEECNPACIMGGEMIVLEDFFVWVGEEEEKLPLHAYSDD